MTKHTPASLLFNGRRYKTRIPTLTGKKHLLYDSEVRSNDAMSKDVMKRATDSKSYVKELDIKEGDTVLCRQAKHDKRTTPFHSEPMRVVMRRGSMVTARNDTRTLTRHVTFFKKLQNADYQQQAKAPDYAAQTTQQNAWVYPSGETAQLAEEVLEGEEEQTQRERPARTRQAPARYRDCNFHTNLSGGK